jgi:GNAT superfamily N-acetyltransferase
MAQTFEVTADSRRVEWERVQELFVQVGWQRRDVHEIQAAFAKSSHHFFAYAGDELIGFGRTTDDGFNYALICDLVIDPRFQSQGIGAKLLERLRIACDRFRFVTLTAAEGKDEFYLRQGWQRQTTSFIWPRDAEQARIHAAS